MATERQTANSKAIETLAKQIFIRRVTDLEETDVVRDAATQSIRDAQIFDDTFLRSESYQTETVED